MKKRKSLPPKYTTSIAALRGEGVFEVGRPAGTSVVFVVTEDRAMLCHVNDIPARELDAYGASAVVAMLERGERVVDVAAGLGVTQDDVRASTRRLGYSSRPSTMPDRPRAS